MSKIFANIATDRFKDLISNLSQLEIVDRQRMSSDGKKYMDRIWKLLGQPTYDEVQAKVETDLNGSVESKVEDKLKSMGYHGFKEEEE